MPKPAPDSHDFSTLEPDILDESITAADLMFMLEHLHFGRNARSTRQSALLLPAVQWLMGMTEKISGQENQGRNSAIHRLWREVTSARPYAGMYTHASVSRVSMNE